MYVLKLENNYLTAYHIHCAKLISDPPYTHTEKGHFTSHRHIELSVCQNKQETSPAEQSHNLISFLNLDIIIDSESW